jgi:hypothetical protein
MDSGDASFRPILSKVLRERTGFGHREHLELAWSYLQDDEFAIASQKMSDAIRHVVEAHGFPNRYHDTMTRCWVRLVALHHAHAPARTFDEFIDRNRDLLNRYLLRRHYSDELLQAPAARASWIPPDLVPLPQSV